EPFFEIAQDKEADAQLIADLDHILVCLRKNREPEKDHLIDSMLANDLFELLRAAEQRQVGVVNLFVILNQANSAKPDFIIGVNPIALLGSALARTDENGLVFAPENSAGQNRRQIIMRKEQRDIEPRHEVE